MKANLSQRPPLSILATIPLLLKSGEIDNDTKTDQDICLALANVCNKTLAPQNDSHTQTHKQQGHKTATRAHSGDNHTHTTTIVG